MSQERSTGQDARGGDAGLGDDQGTRVGAPETIPKAPDQHSDEPSARAERRTGSGSEATEGQRTGSEPLADGEDQHRSGYGGAGGAPVTSSDTREPPRTR